MQRMAAVEAIVALGGNVGDVVQHFRFARSALQAITKTRVIVSSSIYQTRPIGPDGQDDYLNAVLLLHTEMRALELLQQMQKIEDDCNRTRTIRWGPRTLDLDLIDYAGEVLHSTRLVLPHPEMHQRSFVLQPLAEIKPDWQHPIVEQSLPSLLARCGDDGTVLLARGW